MPVLRYQTEINLKKYMSWDSYHCQGWATTKSNDNNYDNSNYDNNNNNNNNNNNSNKIK